MSSSGFGPRGIPDRERSAGAVVGWNYHVLRRAEITPSGVARPSFWVARSRSPRSAPAAFDGDSEMVCPRESHRAADIFGVRRADDHGRTAIDHRVDELRGVVVSALSRMEQLAPERRTQAVHGRWVERWRRQPGRHARHISRSGRHLVTVASGKRGFGYFEPAPLAYDVNGLDLRPGRTTVA